MPKLSDWGDHKFTKPGGDNEYFEKMSRVIFVAGLNWKVVDNKWPAIKKAFAGFDVNKVAAFSETQIEELMFNKDIIRNFAKLKGTVANAKQFQQISKDYGSFSKYLEALRKEGGEDALRSQIAKRFAFLGDGTTVMFLYGVGEDLPKTMQQMQAKHSTKK